MKLVVIIATLGRGSQLCRLLSHLQRQTQPPDEVVVSAPDATHVELPETSCFPVSLVFGKKGSCVQRNSALDHTSGRFDVVTFFDDDFVPADDYLERITRAFEEHDDWAVVMGRVVKDGAVNAGLDWHDAMLALHQSEQEPPPQPEVVDHLGAYGCNMSIRAARIGKLRFDERLVLYGWQEDIDFSSQLRSCGRVVAVNTIRGIHLGIKTGRVSGERFGYSQIVNPVYLIKKGTMPATFALPLMARNVAANLVRSVRPESYIDRRGRLRGNILAMLHVLTGRIEPEYVLDMGRIRHSGDPHV
ncbi:MAG: glycosyltransferase family 2 protein [Mesorhizobium sp.]|uniref:glycosyltransferase family 2 protein n=1 Tax=Mesorhizobium sp. TaxID=1871066 RepID=UPI000FE4EFE1|nr:glycosyltransferase [Mesorhizobium sp.]RWP46010.1 MAG: glycosyltransferase [Mesorhizobium sp.]TIM30767.1 MAG: glycosyltransferase family 2 protein [Mesorhizobium sp.]